MEGTASGPWKLVEIPTKNVRQPIFSPTKRWLFQEAGAKAIEAAFRRCALYRIYHIDVKHICSVVKLISPLVPQISVIELGQH